jgi:FkbM family methyltransferase
VSDFGRRARAAFYRADGPWIRRGLFEAVGSRRYSQPAEPGLDRLAELVPDRPGTFLEAGAHDGYSLSNTYYLERVMGWRGVLIEAVPALYEKTRRRRTRSQVVNAALVSPEREGQSVTVHFGDLTSTIDDPSIAERGLINAGMSGYSVDVPGRTLSSILDDAGIGAPDLMVLDIEGHELEALKGLELDRHAPRMLVVEMLEADAQKPAFDALLGDRYLFEEMLTPFDGLYRLR